MTVGAGRARIAIRGNSGSQVSVVDAGSSAVVVKTASSGPQASRLKRQIAKQRQARLDNTLPFVRVPEIVSESADEGAYRATMEYVYFQNPVEYLNSVSIAGVRRLCDMLFAFVDSEIESSPITAVPTEIFLTKLDDITQALSAGSDLPIYRDHLDRLRRHLGAANSVDLPIGRCHGDLTVSNILVAHDSSAIALVDFLDSFIESPMIDLTKLRQDTQFHWTLLMADHPVDRVRFAQIMSFIDRSIVRRYIRHDWYAENMGPMMAMNLLRIAPYATSDAVHRFLDQSLVRLRM